MNYTVFIQGDKHIIMCMTNVFCVAYCRVSTAADIGDSAAMVVHCGPGNLCFSASEYSARRSVLCRCYNAVEQRYSKGENVCCYSLLNFNFQNPTDISLSFPEMSGIK